MMQKCLSIIVLSASFLGSAGEFEIHGHRGMGGPPFENTLPAFCSALDTKVDVLELDLHLTKDHAFLIHHDPRIKWDGKLINSLNLNEINRIVCEGVQIPTLQELVLMLQSSLNPAAKKVRLNLEIKRDPSHPEETLPPHELAKRLVDEVRECGFSDRVYYTSFDPVVLQEVRKLDSQARLGFIYNQESLSEATKHASHNGMAFILDFAAAIKAEILIPEHTLLETPHSVHVLQASGFRVIPWTVNDPVRQSQLIDMGVDGIITDYPQVLRKILDGK